MGNLQSSEYLDEESFCRNFDQARTGREKEFEAALRRFRGPNADISHEATEIKVDTLVTFYS